MKSIYVALAALGLLACQGVAWADAAALAAGVETGNGDSKLMAKATKSLFPQELQAVIDYHAAEANK